MTTFLQAGIICCAALLLTTMLTVPAEARIECRGNFQMTKYGPIADALLRGRANRLRGAELRAERHGRPGAERPADESVSLPDAGI